MDLDVRTSNASISINNAMKIHNCKMKKVNRTQWFTVTVHPHQRIKVDAYNQNKKNWLYQSCKCRPPSIQWTLLNQNFHRQTKLWAYSSAAKVTRLLWKQGNWQITIAQKDTCRKFEFHTPSSSKNTSICVCCHSNKFTVASRRTTDCHSSKAYLYQYKAHTHSNLSLLPW